MNKIRLLKLGDIPTDEHIQPMRDYKITIVAARVSEEARDSESDTEPYYVFRLEVSHVESIEDIAESKKIKIEPGRTPSQKQRWLITQEIGSDEYDGMMAALLEAMPRLCEMYREYGKIDL